MSFESQIRDLGDIEFPSFSGLRIMMMPFRLEAMATVPPAYRKFVASMLMRVPHRPGTGYLTIDEAVVKAGETHRRPGLHVDGVGPDGGTGSWGGGPPTWAPKELGMLTASSVAGCRGWIGNIKGTPKSNGDCQHLAKLCNPYDAMVFEADRVYWCNSLALHESLPMPITQERQFVRLSMPSVAPWYAGYTPSPYGVKPAGEIHAPRTAFMEYRV